jgi:predicted DNA-binding transcriptional regulator YafY
MNRIDRLLGTLTLLQSKKYITANQIADRFHISIRTVYRDIKALGELGIPVGFEPNQGYFVVQGYFLPPVAFSFEEASALLLMERMVMSVADKSIQTHYSQALHKVRSVLRHSQKEKLETLDEKVRLQFPAFMNRDFAHLSTLQNAISVQHVIEIEYKDSKDELSVRCAEPIGLIFYAFNWHLIAWCHIRRDYRDFRVSRIQQVKCLDTPFTKNDHMKLSDYMEQLPVAY